MKLFIIPLFFLIYFAGKSEAEEVIQVETVGNSRISRQVMLSAFGTEAGDDFDREKIRKGIKNLYGIGLFTDIVVEMERQADGKIKLFLKVMEAPVVERITFSGLEKVKAKDLRKKLEFRLGQTFSYSKATRSVNEMKSIYYEKGYFLVEIETEIDTLSGNRVNIAFNVDEGKKVTIKSITFDGNADLSDKELRKKSDMDSKEDRWYRSGEFKQETFDEDLKKIVVYYRKKGYIDAKIVDYKISYNTEKTHIFINIQVEEGQQYHVESVSWEGHTLFTRKQLDRSLKYDEGDIYNQEKMDKTMENLYTMYSEEGYIYANIIPDRYTEDTAVRITYQIIENDPAHIHKIDIAGNYQTREKVLRRELAIKPGDMFKRSALVRSQRNVLNLGFFDDVLLETARANDDGDIDLTFVAKEKSTGQVSMGAGYSSMDRLTGFLQLSQPNMFGKAQTANLRWEFGKTRQNIELGFTEPWFRDTPTTVGIDLFHTSRSYRGEYYELYRTGGALRLGRPIPHFDFARIYWKYRLEKRDLQFDDGQEYRYSQNFRNQEGKRLQSSMAFTIVRDSRDNRFHATQGSRTTLHAEFSGAYLGGEVDYQKYEVETGWYFTMIHPFVLMVKSEFGVVAGYSENATIPLDEHYYPGGTSFDGVIRGYKDRDVVPSSDGSRSKIIFNVENQFRMVEQVYGLMFFDAGSSWDTIIEARPTDLKRGAGFGIRIETPMGPIGFDYGYGFDKVNPGWEAHFQFGTIF